MKARTGLGKRKQRVLGGFGLVVLVGLPGLHWVCMAWAVYDGLLTYGLCLHVG